MSTLPASGGDVACPQPSLPTASQRGANPSTRPFRRLARAAGAVGLAVLVLSACGGQDGHGDSHRVGAEISAPTTSAAVAGSAGAASADAAADTPNDADIAFAQGMIVHHQGALEMSRLAADRAGSDTVRQLAARIEAAQTPEIELMTRWLQTWSAAVPAVAPTTGSESAGHDMSGHGVPGESTADHQAMGMMSDEDMAELQTSSGADFDRRYLELMVVHHQGAVTMSQAELDDGQSVAALALARTIIDSQTAEIAEMRGLLDAA